MTSYRFKRRAFLAGVGGAFGLRTLLDNLEASAEGRTSPPRFLLMHWPVGTIRFHFVPNGAGTTYETSRILKPFEDAGLREDMIVLYGLSHNGISAGMGGGAEAGTVMATTGADSPGCRENGGEQDDAVAGGPSFDQLFLRRVPELFPGGRGYVNAIADARVDSYEVSTQCLSYGYDRREVASARPSGVITENTPLRPMPKPLLLYSELFSSFMPGGGGSDNRAAALRALKLRKSVLDSALRELDRVRTLAPSSEAQKIDAHADAIRKLEVELEQAIDDGAPSACSAPVAPDEGLEAKIGSGLFDYGNPRAEQEDASHMERVGKAHAAIIRAAFQCDLLRVATLQWCPGTNHVAFQGLYPSDPEGAYLHHPMSHRVADSAFFNGPPPTNADQLDIYEFLTNVNAWFNAKTADVLRDLKDSEDVFGGNLLDHTIVPYVTEVAEAGSTRSPLPALILGGRALGMQGGQFQNFSPARSHNDLWMSIAQAYLNTTDPVSALADEVFVKTGVSPIDGLWKPPA
jgi:hypothetical protein